MSTYQTCRHVFKYSIDTFHVTSFDSIYCLHTTFYHHKKQCDKHFQRRTKQNENESIKQKMKPFVYNTFNTWIVRLVERSKTLNAKYFGKQHSLEYNISSEVWHTFPFFINKNKSTEIWMWNVNITVFLCEILIDPNSTVAFWICGK